MQLRSVLALCAVMALAGCQKSVEKFGSIDDELTRLASLKGLSCEAKQRRIATCHYDGKAFYVTAPGTRVERISIPAESSASLLRALGPHYGFSPNQLARIMEGKPGVRVTREPFSLWQEGPVIRLTRS